MYSSVSTQCQTVNIEAMFYSQIFLILYTEHMGTFHVAIVSKRIQIVTKL